MNLVDIGANLTHESFASDFDRVLADAKSAGVGHIILTGTDLPSSEAAAKLAQAAPNYFSCTAGFHPHVASTCGEAELARIAELSQHQELVAIGETGLDYNRNFSPPATQRIVFEQHLRLAAEKQKPLFLHQRDAHEDFVTLLRSYRDQLIGGVVHCFTDSEQALSDYLELDMYIGITGWICDERRGKPLQELVANIPANRLLIETDSPYLLPRNLTPKPKSRRNEPRYLPAVLEKIAECLGRDTKTLADETTANAQRLFGLQMVKAPTPR